MFDLLLSNFLKFVDSLTLQEIGLGVAVYCFLSFLLVNFLARFRTTQETIYFCFMIIGLITGAFAINQFLFHDVVHISKFTFYNTSIFAINVAIFVIYRIYSYFKENKNYLTNIDLAQFGIKDAKTNNNNSENNEDIVKHSIAEDKKDDMNVYKIENYNYYYQQNNDKYADPYTSKALTNKVPDKLNTEKETESNKIEKEANTEDEHIALQEVNTAQIEENVMQKVQNLISENNVNIDNKINELNENINNIGDGVQGVVNRMSKLFELINQTIKVQIKQQQEG